MGEYENDKKHGYGEYFWQDGSCYKGHWNEGLKHGKGVMEDKNGNRREGLWKKGKLINIRKK